MGAFQFHSLRAHALAHRIMAEIDPERRDEWLELYQPRRLHGRDHNKGPSIGWSCFVAAQSISTPAAGSATPRSAVLDFRRVAGSAARVRDLEEDTALRAVYDEGLAANATAAMHYVGQHSWFDNNEPTSCGARLALPQRRWRQPQVDVEAALDVRQHAATAIGSGRTLAQGL